MKVVDLKTFLSYPDGVVFAEWKPFIMGEVMVRGGVCRDDNLSSNAYQAFGLMSETEVPICEIGDDSPIVTDEYHRNGPGLNPKQLFIVFDKKDIGELIERLQRAHGEAKE